jgi:hypothetical protein
MQLLAMRWLLLFSAMVVTRVSAQAGLLAPVARQFYFAKRLDWTADASVNR